LREALALAQQRGFDLVEIAPNANPPVCKILEYGKFRYEQAKKEKESRKQSAASKIKQIKFHVSISEHDYQIKLRQIESFLDKHMKCKVSLFFRGRELAHQELGMQIMQRLSTDVQEHGTVEMEPKMIGRGVNMLISPHSVKKGKGHAAPPPRDVEPHPHRVMAVEVKAAPAAPPENKPAPSGPPAWSGSPLNPLGAAFDRLQQQNKGS
jgi:translation initiation factor IF-3